MMNKNKIIKIKFFKAIIFIKFKYSFNLLILYNKTLKEKLKSIK